MLDLSNSLERYLEYCHYQKGLTKKTCKAYRIDLTQFICFFHENGMELSKVLLSAYITELHKSYQPKSARRKIASLKAYFNYLEYEEVLADNPLSKMKIKFKEPFILPKTIPLDLIQQLLTSAYQSAREGVSQMALRDIAVLEMLFATGIRVSELCSLKIDDIDLVSGIIKIYGKGSKERIVQIGNQDVIAIFNAYVNAYNAIIQQTGYFFVNRLKRRLSEQSVRTIINHYAKACKSPLHITPHMFRHSFATLLLEEEVDIRYIQHLLGHSSITTTQIYTHVTSAKQRNILETKHPRNKMKL